MLTPPRRHITIAVSTRPVKCYHCFHAFQVAETARSHCCPRCSRRVELDDFVVADASYSGQLRTCGRVVIGPHASIAPRTPVHAGEGVEIAGLAQGTIYSAGTVNFHRSATFRGTCRASGLTVEEGAAIQGYFEIRPAQPGVSEPPTPDVVTRPHEPTLDAGTPAFRATPLVRAMEALSAAVRG